MQPLTWAALHRPVGGRHDAGAIEVEGKLPRGIHPSPACSFALRSRLSSQITAGVGRSLGLHRALAGLRPEAQRDHFGRGHIADLDVCAPVRRPFHRQR